MTNTQKNYVLCAAVLMVGSMLVASASTADPGLRLWQRQHPGSTPGHQTNNGVTSLYRSFSYEPATPVQNVVTPPVPPVSSQTVRSYSYEPAASPAVAVSPTPCPSSGPQTVRSFSYEPAPVAVSSPQVVRSYSYEPGINSTGTVRRWMSGTGSHGPSQIQRRQHPGTSFFTP